MWRTPEKRRNHEEVSYYRGGASEEGKSFCTGENKDDTIRRLRDLLKMHEDTIKDLNGVDVCSLITELRKRLLTNPDSMESVDLNEK